MKFLLLLLMPFILWGTTQDVTLTEVKGNNFRYYYVDSLTWNAGNGDTLETSAVTICDFDYYSLKLGGAFDDVDVYYMTVCDEVQFTQNYWPDLIFLANIANVSVQPQLFTALDLAADVKIKFYIISKKVKNRTGCRLFFVVVDDILEGM